MNNTDNLNISLLVGLKNNLDYSQFFYETTRSLYPNVEIVFVSYGSTDETHDWLDSIAKNDNNLKIYYSSEIMTFSDTYNKCIEIATCEYVVFLHNDMVLTPNFLENILKYLNDDTIVGFSTIEPPIFSDDSKSGKIVEDFGTDIPSLRIQDLYKFSLEKQNDNDNKIENSLNLWFFIAIKKDNLKQAGGLDNLYTMFYEDLDLFLRLEYLGLKTILSLDAICYHFVSKTSRFSEEIVKRTKEIENNSRRNFLRKWGFSSYNDKRKKSNIGILIRNASLPIIKEIEPYASKVYADCDFSEYIKEEQPKTKFDLRERIFPVKSLNDHDILIQIDGEKIEDTSLDFVKNIYRNIDKRRKSFFKSLFSGKNKINKKGITVKIYNYN